MAMLIAVAGGAVLAAWAGARRTDSAYPRLTDATNHADVVVSAQGDPSLFDPAIAADGPGVAASGLVDGYAALELLPDGTIDVSRLGSISALTAPIDATAFYTIDRPLISEGRLPDPAARNEIVVGHGSRADHPVGSTLDVCLFDFEEALLFDEGVFDGVPTPQQNRAFVREVCAVHHLTVVGVQQRGPDDVVLRVESEDTAFLVGTPALAANPGTTRSFSFALVDLEPGADVNAFVDTVLDRTPPEAGVNASATSLRAAVVGRTVDPYIRALVFFAAIAAVAALGVLGPAVARWAATAETDRAALLAAGLRKGQLRAATALRGATLGTVAATGAVIIAVAASGQFPIGAAAAIEPHPGVRIDAAVLAFGGAAILVLCAALGAAAPTTSRPTVRRPSRIADGLQASGVAPAVVSGVRAAVSPGAGAVPMAAGVAIAIAAVVAALTYQAGLGRLLETPSRYGWTWDVAVDGRGEGLPPELLEAVEDEPLVSALTIGRRTSLLRDGTGLPTLVFEPVRGSTYPVIVTGRAPRGEGEVALGSQTLDRFAVDVGDQITFRGPNGVSVDVSVVGRTLLPLLDPAIDISIAEGALVDGPLLERVGGADVDIALIELVPGASGDDLRESLAGRGVELSDSQVMGPEYTADLRGYAAVRNTPLLLAALLAALGLGVLAHTITGTVRRRRRELAVLQSLGFVRRDLRRSVRWNALTLVGVCIVASVPIGIGIGRTLWRSFAAGIGVPDDPVTPALLVAVVVIATIAGTLALAAVPAHRAGRLHPPDVLRSE